MCHLKNLWDSLVVTIGSSATTLSFDDSVSSLLSKGMRKKNMESQNIDSLSTIIFSQNINKNNPSTGGFKSRGRSECLGKFINVCWRCGKEGNYNKDYKSKIDT